MARLEELQAGTRVLGLIPGLAVTVKSASWFGQQAIELVFEDARGGLHERLVYREDEPTIEVADEALMKDEHGHRRKLVHAPALSVEQAQDVRLALLAERGGLTGRTRATTPTSSRHSYQQWVSQVTLRCRPRSRECWR